jgi:hypothetical protein
MTWFKLSDQFYDHPKVMQAGNAAVGLWVRCCTWSSRQLMDGHIPKSTAHHYGTQRDIDRLIQTRLWIVQDDDYWVPDFLEFNPSAAKVLAERAAALERQTLWRQRHKRNAVTNANPEPEPEPVPPAAAAAENSTAVDLNGTAAAAAIDLFITHKLDRDQPRRPDAYRRTLRTEIPTEYADALNEYTASHQTATPNDIARAVFGMTVVDVRRATTHQRNEGVTP